MTYIEGGETTAEIKKATGLNIGNFQYWVKAKSRIFPIGTKIVGRFVVDVYPTGSAERVKVVMSEGRNHRA